jgi:hypothetical protein
MVGNVSIFFRSSLDNKIPPFSAGFLFLKNAFACTPPILYPKVFKKSVYAD